jgi:hypothetical protein
LRSFQTALQAYVDQTQPYRKQAAEAGDRVPDQAGTATNAEVALRTREMLLGEALTTTLRATAKQGDLFVPSASEAIRRDLATVFNGPRRDLLVDALAEQNDEGQVSAPPAAIKIHQNVDAPRVPPLLIESLPRLPKQLEYAFVGRLLLLRDVDAGVVEDYLPDALPEPPPAGVPTVGPAPVASNAPAPLPMPSIRGATIFALIGDAGSGDMPQEMVASTMLNYFLTARRFPFVLMLGDNLYDDDYTGEFLVPYKPLLDRGVEFFAALGNHDRAIEQHFKPFNMQDREYYSFDRGNARFVALNTNRPADPMQAEWLGRVFADAGTKWRIAFFHHPLYSSGNHAVESRTVIRPALEPLMARSRINVVFSGHEHLYERVAPQNGVRYFVSGGGGRSLYGVRPNPFDEVAASDYHFMVVEIADDRLFFEAITPSQKVLDCGVIYRTPDAESKSSDRDTQVWMTACSSARPTRQTSQ